MPLDPRRVSFFKKEGPGGAVIVGWKFSFRNYPYTNFIMLNERVDWRRRESRKLREILMINAQDTWEKLEARHAA